MGRVAGVAIRGAQPGRQGATRIAILGGTGALAIRLAGGRELATITCVADEIRAVAGDRRGGGGVPVAVARGAPYSPDDSDEGASELIRPLERDLFR